MIVKHEQLTVKSNGVRVTYKNMTEEVKKFFQDAGIKDGICVVSTPHTTCSIIFDEFTHDYDWNGDELLQVDMNRILEKLVPRQLTESDYLYPGPEHVQFLQDLAAEDPQYPADPATILNADEVKDGELQIGSVGYIYFVDWDQNRVRNRKCNVLLMGQ